MNPLNRLLLLIFVGLSSVSVAKADVSVPAIFSDHMVLQQQAGVPVWGWADPGEKVTVQCSGQSQSVVADNDGQWMTRLQNLTTGQPTTLVIQGNNKITIDDVLVGEVWLGSGQSNMAMTVSRAKDFASEQKQADLPQIRMFKESSGPSKTPQRVGRGSWQICTPDSVGGFSATLFFFGREIHSELNVPVGLVNSSVGGTPIESWINADAQRSSEELKPFFAAIDRANAAVDLEKEKANYQRALQRHKEAAAKAKQAGKPAPRKPRDPAELRARKGNVGGLFNGKIEPLIPYAIRGALWYQGEANTVPNKAQYYGDHLALLVTDWRQRWGYDFPFAWAQLPNYIGAGRDWPTVREGMLNTLALPNTGMGINIDIGESKDIHPKNKQEIGRRLSLWALGTVYEKPVAAVSGPLPDGHELDSGKVIVKFKHAAGLKAVGGKLTGFEITEDNQEWHAAVASIDADKVIVSSPMVKSPIAVRYAWENDPKCNLFNGAGLPATPFRTNP